jgi:MFS family permease
VFLYTGSVAAIAAQSSLAPIVALRFPQGIGVAILFTLGPALVARAFGPQRRGAALGVTLSAVGLGTFAGTMGGGLLTEHIGWQAIFWARVPIGVAVFAVAWLGLDSRSGPAAADSSLARVNWSAAFVLFGTLFAFVLALSYARLDGWTALRPAALYAVTASLAAVFVAGQVRSTRRLFPPDLFRIATWRAGAVSNLVVIVGTFVMWFLFPFFVADVMSRGAVALGALLGTMALAQFVGSAVAGWIADRLGDARVTLAGAALAALGLVALGSFDHATGMLLVAGGALLVGLGFGIHQAAAYSLTLRDVHPTHAGPAAATLAVTQTVGTAASIAVMTSLLAWRSRVHVDAPDPFLASYSDIYLVSAALTLLAGIAAVAFSRRRRLAMAPDDSKSAASSY